MDFEFVEIEEFSGSKARIYSIAIDGDEMTLMDHFFDDNKSFQTDLAIIAAKLKTMGEDTGCRPHFFKENEGAPGDGMVALRVNRLRLYCLRYDNTCIFIGSGGYKPPGAKTYQQDEALNKQAQLTRKMVAAINRAIIDRDLVINEDGTIETTQFIDLSI